MGTRFPLIRFRIHSTSKQIRKDLQNSFGGVPDAEKIKIESVSAYWYEKLMHDDAVFPVDDITWNDLDMDKIFSRINACHTSIGEEYLYAALREPLANGAKDPEPPFVIPRPEPESTPDVQEPLPNMPQPAKDEKLRRRENLITRLEADEELRVDLQLFLSKMGRSHYSGLSGFCYDVSSKKLKNHFMYNILPFLPFIFIALLFVNPLIGVFGLIGAVFVNGTIYYMTTVGITHELAAIRYFSASLWCAKQIVKRFDDRGRSIRARTTGRKNAEISEARQQNVSAGDPIISDLNAAYHTFEKLGGKLSTFGQRRMSDFDSLIEYFRILSLSNIRHYNKVIDILEKNTEAFRLLYTSLGEIDTAISILSFRKSLPFFTLPDFVTENKLCGEALFHPLIADPVCNSISMKENSLISGSNASGKSTFVKAIAVNAILAQTINTCCAKHFETRFALVLSSMAVRDDITAGDSYFISEIKSLKRILDKIPQVNCICVIDEILRGTNTIERIAASVSVLKHCANLDCLCIVATHDIELTDILTGIYRNYHFSEQITDAGIVFDYIVKDGPTKTRNAITLLDHLGFDEDITSEAKTRAERFEKT